MPKYRTGEKAFGAPGLEPKWAHGDKDGIGTAYSGSSRLWFTLWNGIVTELYYPTVDRPQLRDLQFLISDGETFLHRETDEMKTHIKRIDQVLAYQVQAQDPEGRYSFEKMIIADPHQPCLLIHVRVRATAEAVKRLKMYVLCAPHLECGGAHNSGYVIESTGFSRVLMSHKDGMWMVISATHPFSKASAGYVGTSDGFTDLSADYRMKWEFDKAENGNIALMGEIPLDEAQEFTLGVAFGETLQRALTTLFQSISTPFQKHHERYVEQWLRATNSLNDLTRQSSDEGLLYSASCQILLAHEDKLYQGAMIASLAIPWGHVRGDKEGAGGYHLVWPRDIVQSTLALLATGNRETPLRSLIYLATAQQDDGGFAQNFWIDGTPFWKGVQLDEAAFPILLAYHLWKEEALAGFNPLPMIVGAASYLVRQGPVTGQERWEENSGYSPSTLAACIAALIAASAYIRFSGDEKSALFLEEYSDYLESHLEEWTTTSVGKVSKDIASHYVRINPMKRGKASRSGDIENAKLKLTSHKPGTKMEFPANSIVDGGFLELVRYGIRCPNDPMIERSVRVIDEVLKVDTPSGTCWRRYNHDGYGQRDNGDAYDEYGVGRAWPLLAGERGHYEIAAGRLAVEQISSMEGFATPTHLLPEQVWDMPDLAPEKHLRCGRPTGSAAPLMWAHAEYIKLLRSARDEKVYETVDEAAIRYQGTEKRVLSYSIWSFNHPITQRRDGETVRVIAEAEFEVQWTHDRSPAIRKISSTQTELGIYYADLKEVPSDSKQLSFTFHWRTAKPSVSKRFSIEVQKK